MRPPPEHCVCEDCTSADLKVELSRQVAKHGDLPSDDLKCSAILSEECGEVARAVLESSPRESLRAELLQVACFALRWRNAL